MEATRISVEWMTTVPRNEEGGSDFDHAGWASKEFPGGASDQARVFAHAEAARNQYGQVWIKTEHAPYATAPDHLWEQDHDATEIIEA